MKTQKIKKSHKQYWSSKREREKKKNNQGQSYVDSHSELCGFIWMAWAIFSCKCIEYSPDVLYYSPVFTFPDENPVTMTKEIYSSAVI